MNQLKHKTNCVRSFQTETQVSRNYCSKPFLHSNAEHGITFLCMVQGCPVCGVVYIYGINQNKQSRDLYERLTFFLRPLKKHPQKFVFGHFFYIFLFNMLSKLHISFEKNIFFQFSWIFFEVFQRFFHKNEKFTIYRPKKIHEK